MAAPLRLYRSQGGVAATKSGIGLDREMEPGGALLATPGSRCEVPDRRCLRRLELHLSAMA